MARKKKRISSDPKIFNEKPENLDGMKKLKGGEVVMYRNPTLFDKCTVESIDKKDGTAMLSNGVKVSRGILPDNHILRIGNTTEKTEIKLWDDECETLYQVFLYKRSIRQVTESLRKLADNANTSNETILKLGKMLDRVKERLEKKE